MSKYAQSAIATTGLYESAPGTSRNRLYGFYSAKRERTLTGQVKPAQEVGETPFKFVHPKSFLLTKSVLPLKRDKKSRPIK